MSPLLDRYIHAVERRLPAEQRQDIAAELRETIESRMQEEAADRGRDLTEAEQAAILKSIGPPIVVAARYGSTQYLVGPALYPYYVATLRTVASIGLPLLVIAVVVGALGADNPLLGALHVVARAFSAACVALGIVTLIFWQMGRVAPGPDFEPHWDPAHLPEVPSTEPYAVPRARSIGHAALVSVYLLWWVGALPLPRLLQLWPYTPVAAPVWQDVSFAVTLLMTLALLLHGLAIWRPQVPRWRLGLHVAGDAVALGIIAYLLQADELVLMPPGGPWTGQQDTINDATRVGLLILATLIGLDMVFDEGKRLLGRHPGDTPFNRGAFAGVVAARAVRAAGIARPHHPGRPQPRR